MRRAKRGAAARRVRPGARAWTPQEVSTLRQMYRTESSTEIGKALRRSIASVQAKARSLGLRKPKTWRATPKTKPARKVGGRRRRR